MVKIYQQLWKDTTEANDETKAVQALTAILVDKEGRTFISNLERGDVELCIELLDRVSHDPCPLSTFVVSDGPVRLSEITATTLKTPGGSFFLSR